MTTTPPLDVTSAIQAKSDQLNAADLAQPITVRIVGVRRSTGQADVEKQPFEVVLSEPWKPWRPCKTSFRLLSSMWGTDASRWVGHTIRLYNDPTVTFGKESTGGIRISGADIERPHTQSIQVARGRYKLYTVEPIPPLATEAPREFRKPSPLAAYLGERIPTLIDPPLTGEEKRALLAHLGTDPHLLQDLQAMDDDAFKALILTACGRAS